MASSYLFVNFIPCVEKHFYPLTVLTNFAITFLFVKFKNHVTLKIL